MSLRPLVEIALEDDRFRSLASAAREAAGGGDGPVAAHMSGGVCPYLLAALVEAEYGFAGRPALIVTADDRSADLAGRPQRTARLSSRSPAAFSVSIQYAFGAWATRALTKAFMAARCCTRRSFVRNSG